MKKYQADLALLLVTIIWGATFPMIRSAVSKIDSYQFVFFRFLFALALFSLGYVRIRRLPKKTWRIFSLMSVCLWASYITQTIGMETISSGRAAFITGLNVIMVPFLAPLAGLRPPTSVDLGSAVGAGVGLYFLTDPGNIGFGVGDVWVLLCALSYALYIVILQKMLEAEKVDSVSLAYWQVMAVALLSTLCLPLSKAPIAWPQASSVWVALVFCATLATVLTCWLQTNYQKYTTAQRTALIFAMEPVFAVLFGYVLLGELMSMKMLIGAVIILVSIIVGELWKLKFPAAHP